LNLSVQAKTAVERIRTSPLSRGVKSGAGNVSGAYPSRKMGDAIQFESHKNELATIYRLEHDPDVVFIDEDAARPERGGWSREGNRISGGQYNASGSAAIPLT
jgi:hypothetical protein